MKITLYLLTAITVLFFQTPATAQKKIQFDWQSGKSFHVIPYGDGSFTVYSTFAAKSRKEPNTLIRTYSQGGELLFEKFTHNNFAFNLGTKVSDGFAPLLVFSNPDLKLSFNIGMKGNSVICRVLNSEGNTRDIELYKVQMDYLMPNGYGFDDENGLNLLFSDVNVVSKNNAKFIHVDLETDAVTTQNLKDKITGKNSLHFLGTLSGQLTFVNGSDANANECKLVLINNEGKVTEKTVPLPVEVSAGSQNLANPVNVYGEKDNNIYFMMGGTPGYRNLMRLSGNYEITEIQIPYHQAYTDTTVQFQSQYERHIALFRQNNKFTVFQSYLSKTVNFPVSWETQTSEDPNQFQTESFTRYVYDMDEPNLAASSYLNPELGLQRESIEKCSEYKSCLFKVFTLYNSNGSYNFLKITGDYSEAEEQYVNVSITRY